MSLPIDTASTLLEAHPYLLLFPLVLLEGPIATVAAGLLVATGIMSWPVAYAVAVPADLAGGHPLPPAEVGVPQARERAGRVLAGDGLSEGGRGHHGGRQHGPVRGDKDALGPPLAQRCSRPWRASRAWRCSGKPCPGRGRIAARGPGSRAWPLCFLLSLGAARCTCPFRGRPCPGPRFLSARGTLRTGRSYTPVGAKAGGGERPDFGRTVREPGVQVHVKRNLALPRAGSR